MELLFLGLCLVLAGAYFYSPFEVTISEEDDE